MFQGNGRRLLILCGAVAGVCGLAPATFAANVAIILPLHRVAYQTNEWIDVSVVRSDATALAAGNLTLSVSGDDASKMVFTFPAKAVAVEGKDARETAHLHLNGQLIRPGKYTIEAAVDGATASTAIEVYSHIRRSNFKLIDWGSSSSGKEQAVLGEDGMGFNLIYFTRLSPDDMIRGGADFMRNCTMSGGHQMDLRQECDWSDPYALQGGEARVVNEALQDRTLPNCLGVHFYDEPGLTWWKDPKNENVMVPFNIPSQDRSYKSAFGAEPPHWSDVKPNDPAAVAKWDAMNRWKESFLEAAWKYSAFGVSQVRPDFLSVTQSQYGWMAYADGYYFNVARALPVISGHGGYDDGPATYFYPSFFHEMGRIRDTNKPIWYLPTWYGESSDQYRLEQYLSFMTDLQGMAKPPDMKVQDPAKTKDADGIVESNKLMARIGTIFTTMRPTRPEVAMLYSLSQDLGAEVRDMQDHKKIDIAAYEGGDHTRAKMLAAYLAGKFIHMPLWPIVEEDVLDGTLAANHKAVVLAGIDTLDPKVITALEAYAAGGGVVIVSDDCHVQIKGATKLGAEAPVKLYHEMNESWAKDQKHSMEIRRVEYWQKEVAPFAKALQGRLSALGLKPALDADKPGIITQRQAQGDIEYLFAVNATPYAHNPDAQIQSASATLSTAADDRPIYDVVHSQLEPGFKPVDHRLAGEFVFGPGEMRVFARTARPVGGVQVQMPVLFRDFTVASAPIRIESSAMLLDNQHGVICGSAPMQIRLIDPLGQVRYDLYRATDRGVLRIDLPLAANDPAGEWKLTVRELLNNKEATASFTYHPAAQCGAMAGATHRAVSFGDDADHIFKLFRTHQDFTIVVGKGDYDAAAARIAEILKPWGAECKVVKAADVKVNQPSPEALKTWTGLSPGRPDPKNLNAAAVGFDLRGPAILLGNAADNPLIKFAEEQKFLPYKADAKDFPGRGRGYIAWQRDAVSYGAESVTLIGYDAEGISQAIGTFYEAVAGIDPLTKYDLPAPANITPATTRTAAPEAAIAWKVALPDRAVSMVIDAGKIALTTEDGSMTELEADGKLFLHQAGIAEPKRAASGALPKDLPKSILPNRIVKTIATADGLTAIGYWGGTVQILDAAGATKSSQVLPNDITDMGWLKGKLIVALADGSVMALEVK
ncbi:MAG TPA: hypothetical protein VFE47_05710 [Tepidisphaeraceae bacterium]|jgi:hypothetical protein|nr:hypothetical protein [Tepidisphaeraceae bacterium]